MKKYNDMHSDMHNDNLIVMNLQLFAEDKDGKTEKATPKKGKMLEKKVRYFKAEKYPPPFCLYCCFYI